MANLDQPMDQLAIRTGTCTWPGGGGKNLDFWKKGPINLNRFFRGDQQHFDAGTSK